MGLEALGSNGKFLGRWSPASTCKCWCGRKLSLSDGLWWLAVVQILTSSASLLSKIISFSDGEPPESLSEPTVEIGLALLMLDAIKNVKKDPILDFAFIQFILAIKGSIDCIATTLFVFVTAGKGDDDGAVKVAAGVFSLIYAWCTVPYKVYYSYIAWSFVATNFTEDLEELKKHGPSALSTFGQRSLSRAEGFLFNSLSTELIANDGSADPKEATTEGAVGTSVIISNEEQTPTKEVTTHGSSIV